MGDLRNACPKCGRSTEQKQVKGLVFDYCWRCGVSDPLHRFDRSLGSVYRYAEQQELGEQGRLL